MEGRTLRLAVSFIRAAGWRKLITLLALVAVFGATFGGYVAATATERNALDWYIGAAYPDFRLTPLVKPESPPPMYTTAADLVNLSRQAANVSAALEALPNVVSARLELWTIFVTFNRPAFNAPSTGGPSFVTIAMPQAEQEKYVARIVAGTSDLGPAGVLVPENVAAAAGLSVGQTVPLYSTYFFSPENCTAPCPLEPAYVNVTVEGVYAPKSGPVGYDNNVFPWAYADYVIPVILNLSQLPALVPAVVPANAYPWQVPEYDVFVARNAILDPFDSAGNTRRLGALKIQMDLVAQKYGLVVYSNLGYAYSYYLQDRSYVDLAVLFGVAPVLLVAVVLGVLMESAEVLVRYRDLSIARARGVGLRRLRRVLWLEGIVEACLASVAGLGAGVLGTLLLEPGAVPAIAAVGVLAVLVSFLLCLGIALGMKVLAVKGLGRHSIAAGLAQQRDGPVGKDMGGRLALLALGIGAALFGASWFMTATLLSATSVASLLFGTLRDWALSLSLLAFLFVLGVYAPRISHWVARKWRNRVGAGSAQALYRASLVRSKRSPDAAVLLVASLVVSASVFTAGLVVLQRASVENAIYSETGSDILLTLPGNPFGGPAGQSNPPIQAFLSVLGVADLTFASTGFSGGVGFPVDLVNASTYLGTVRTDKLLYGATLAGALDGFARPGAAVVNDAFVESTGLGVGSPLGNLTITGVVPEMPGLQPSGPSGSPMIFTDYRNYGLTPDQTDIQRVLVRVAPGVDPGPVMTQLTGLDQNALARNAAQEVGEVDASPLLGALGSLWTVALGAFAFLLFVALAGYAVRIGADWESDFSRMRARGLPRRSVPPLLLAPVLSTVLASILWGVGIGELLFVVMALVSSPVGGIPLALLLPSLSVLLLIVLYVVVGTGIALGLARGFGRLRLGPRLRERVV